jgi:hypothetical protein
VTIADIARAADVPVESVLRVLSRDEVSSDVAARVHEAIERYGYGRMPRLASDARETSSFPAVPGEIGWDEPSDLGDADALMHRLAQDVHEIKVELQRARTERLEDLTLVVDLITTSWRAVDRRLGRIDGALERLEGPRNRGSRPRLP